VKRRNAGVSHCPNSNFTLKSGVLDAGRLLKQDIKVGLGTDVSGGYACNMFEAMRSSIKASVAIHHLPQPAAAATTTTDAATSSSSSSSSSPPVPSMPDVDVNQALYMATLGGADVCGLRDRVGNFAVGMELDALVIDPLVDTSAFDVFDSDTLHDVLLKFLFTGDDRNVQQVWVSGRRVHCTVDDAVAVGVSPSSRNGKSPKRRPTTRRIDGGGNDDAADHATRSKKAKS
jgi:guanine deaminase